jgi:hypothetical protein
MRFPPPSTTGAIEIDSSSTCPARSAWRMTSAPAHDEHVLAARRVAGPGDRLVQPVHERESRVCGGVLRPVRHDEERHAKRIVAAPRLRCRVRVAAADDGADASRCLVEDLLVRARRLASRLLVVAPRAAEDPVVQTLTPSPKPRPGSSFGPVMFPSSEVVIPAATFVIGLPPWSSPSSVRTRAHVETHRR